MAVLVVLEAVTIALLGVLVAGLLRSHAEILRTLHRLGAGHPLNDSPGGAHTGETPVASARLAAAAQAVDLVGTTPTGETIQLGVRTDRHNTLLAFLSSGCSTCSEFWRAFARPAASLQLPDGTRLVVVTKGPAEESVSRLRDLSPAAVPVVMSSEAWKDYGVPVTPYFLHVDGASGQVVGQGTGSTWSQVASLFDQSRGDDRQGGRRPGGRESRRRQTVAEVEAGVDRKLLAAGIHPGDPSLYPSRQAGSGE